MDCASNTHRKPVLGLGLLAERVYVLVLHLAQLLRGGQLLLLRLPDERLRLVRLLEPQSRSEQRTG